MAVLFSRFQAYQSAIRTRSFATCGGFAGVQRNVPVAKNGKNVSELVRAAEELESELERLEALSEVAQRTRLDSEKNIAKATKELGEVLEMPNRLAERLGSLATAMKHVEARQKAALDPLGARTDAILERKRKLEEHMRAFATLGKAAEEAIALLNSEQERSVLVEDLKKKLDQIADEAKVVFEAARADDFTEVARESDALSKRAAALRRKLE
jgi:DNA-binding transcriptional regulator GbsR (MarR family)